MSWEIFEVFTKGYRQQTAYMELMHNRVDSFRLNDDAEDVDIKIQRLMHHEMKEPAQ